MTATATFTILGTPATKKNSRRVFRNRRTGAMVLAQSAQACAWEQSAALQLAARWHRPPLTCEVSMAAVIYRERNTGDLLNFLANVSDALELARIVENDRLVTGLDGCRLDIDRLRPRVEVTVSWKAEDATS
jgi:hypothetical protein